MQNSRFSLSILFLSLSVTAQISIASLSLGQKSKAKWTKVRLADTCFARSVLAGDSGRFYIGSATCGFFESTDDGKRWSFRSKPEATPLTSLRRVGRGQLIAHATGGYFITSTRGREWRWQEIPLVNGAISDVEIARSGRVYAALPGHGLLVSEDDGNAWRTIRPNVGEREELDLRSIWITPQEVIYLATRRGLLSSPDLGRSWREIYFSEPEARAVLKVVGDSRDNLFVATERAGIWSQRAGDTAWRASNAGLPGISVGTDSLDTFYLTSDLQIGQRDEVVTVSAGRVYQLPDASEAWTELGEGLPIHRSQGIEFGEVQRVAIGRRAIVAVTRSDGVYQLAR